MLFNQKACNDLICSKKFIIPMNLIVFFLYFNAAFFGTHKIAMSVIAITATIVSIVLYCIIIAARTSCKKNYYLYYGIYGILNSIVFVLFAVFCFWNSYKKMFIVFMITSIFSIIIILLLKFNDKRCSENKNKKHEISLGFGVVALFIIIGKILYEYLENKGFVIDTSIVFCLLSLFFSTFYIFLLKYKSC